MYHQNNFIKKSGLKNLFPINQNMTEENEEKVAQVYVKNEFSHFGFNNNPNENQDPECKKKICFCKNYNFFRVSLHINKPYCKF